MPTNRTNRNSSTPAKAHFDESTDRITPLPPTSTRHSVSSRLSTPYTTTPESGHSNVSLPARPPRKHAYSECFDLVEQNQIRSPSGSLLSEIRSPSGNLLSAQQAALRTDRPAGVLERQEAIRKKIRERREYEESREMVEEWKRESGLERQEAARERQRDRERDRVMGEMGLGNWVQVEGGVKGPEVKAKAKTKAKGKRGSFCGCL
jgi:hypothetical protein